MKPQRIAFYGTLMRRAEYHLEELGVASMFDYAGECSIPGLLYHLGEYPGLVEGEGTVPGELYEIRDPRGLDLLDRHEGVDWENPESSLYTRPTIQLLSPNLIAWVYLYKGNVEGLPRLPRWPQPKADASKTELKRPKMQQEEDSSKPHFARTMSFGPRCS